MDYQGLEDQNSSYQFMSTQIGSPSQQPASQSLSQLHQQHNLSYAGPFDSKDPAAGMQNPGGNANDFLPQAYPSPTSILYTSNGNGLPQGRMSDRWDTAQFALPPSSDVSFDMPGMPGMSIGMGMDAAMAGHMGMNLGMGMGMSGEMGMGMGEEDILLHDFGAALAQADEMADAEWQ